VVTVEQYRRWGSDGKVATTTWLVGALISESISESSESIRMIEASGVNQKGVLIRKSKSNRCGRNCQMEHGTHPGL